MDKRRSIADAIELDEALTKIGFGRTQVFLIFACGLISMFNVSETMGVAIIAPACKCDFEMNNWQHIVVQSAAFWGIVLTAYFWGHLCDVIGRRKVLLYTMSGSVFLAILSNLMPSFGSFVVMRILVGMFIAGPSFINPTYLSEFCTNKFRPHVVYSLSMAQGLAMIYSPTLATYIMKGDWYLPMLGPLDYRPWRLLGLLLTLPGILGLLCLLALPESPKFLLSVGQDAHALDVLEWICRHNKRKALAKEGIVQLRVFMAQDEQTAQQSQQQQEMKREYWQGLCSELQVLCRPPYICNFLLSFGIMFGLAFIFNGMGLWFTDMRNRQPGDLHPATVCQTMNAASQNDIEVDAFICNDSFKSFYDSICVGVTFIISYCVLSGLLWVLPRKLIFMVPLLLSFICGMSLNWMTDPHGITLLFILFLTMPGVVVHLLGGAVLDFVPTSLRGKAVCLFVVFGRLGVIVGGMILGNFLDHYMCIYAFNIFACIPLLCATLGFFLPM